MNPIGGEFEINIKGLDFSQNLDSFNYNWFSSGRSAFFAVLTYLKKSRNVERIYIPEFLCQSIISTINASGISFDIYELDDNLHYKQDLFRTSIKNKSVFLLINYFGLQELTIDIKRIKKEIGDIPIILDNVQNSLMNRLNGADFCFNSLRKMLPLPDGANVISKEKIKLEGTIDKNEFAFFKLLGGILKKFRAELKLDDEDYLRFLERGETIIDDNIFDEQISQIAKHIMRKVDINEVIRRRYSNYNYLLELLRYNDLQPALIAEKEDFIPFVVPILLENRDDIKERLKHSKVYTPIHWKNKYAKTKLAKFFSNHELSLIIDQRYYEKDIDRMVKCLLINKPKLLKYVS